MGNKIKNPFNRDDALILIGLCGIGYGAWLVLPAAAFIVVGSLLFLLGVFR